ncbi:hypothetical protein GQ43DRAFT_258394 [Delitschia confertaspora ATCC 74209]|uniref:SnoaL-like domain-containing protein n=1 Tax=Delitschia confertaspora ATCC 74209 TaxID=1513339 RepID=A0A9P4JQ68_9PLEO|nr:hypothetical protein GQ43DRAFT_258394 [Delitschia confertaspora ATCC 74209]
MSTPTDDVVAIKTLFLRYQQTLNNSSLFLLTPLYTTDPNIPPVAMFPHSPPHMGTKAIMAAYTKLFDEVDHMVTISVEEVNVVGEGLGGEKWAFARTTCTGICRSRETGEALRDSVMQLWVLKRGEGEWRIAKYMFAQMD